MRKNVYLRKDGRWEGRYRKGRKPNGKIHYGYIYRKTYSEAVLALQTLQPNDYNLRYGPDLKVSEWAPLWLERVKLNIKLSTYAHYQYKLNQYIMPFFKNHYIGQLNETIIYDFIAYLELHQLQASSIRSIIQVLKQCLRPAFRQLDISSNPFEFVTLPKQKTTTGKSLTRSEQARLEESLTHFLLSESLPVLLALHTGMRIGEISALRWQDVEFDERKIHIKNTYQRIPIQSNQQYQTTLLLGKAKTGMGCRSIPMTEKILINLKQHYRETNSTFVFERNGHPCEPRTISRYYKRIAKVADISGTHFHQLRHTFATRCLEAQGDIASISALLGHKSTQMTLDVYSHTMFDQQLLTIQKFEKLTHLPVQVIDSTPQG